MGHGLETWMTRHLPPPIPNDARPSWPADDLQLLRLERPSTAVGMRQHLMRLPHVKDVLVGNLEVGVFEVRVKLRWYTWFSFGILRRRIRQRVTDFVEANRPVGMYAEVVVR